MKIIVILQILCFCSLFVVAQTGTGSTVNCSNFHKGTFYYADSGGNKVRVIRGKNKQYEHNMVTGINTTLRIKWLSDCAYELTQIWTDSRSHQNQNNGKSVITITNSESAYNYEYNAVCACTAADGKPISQNGVMTKDQ